MNGEKLTPITNKPSLWALSPLLVFLCLYLVTSIIVYNPQIEMFARFKTKSSFHKTKRII